MAKRIAFVGAGAIGGYIGANLTALGHDVTLIDPWPAHVEAMRADGMHLHGMTEAENHTVRVSAMHITDAQQLAKQKPIDIAFIAVKSYDTVWATRLIRQYLAPGGFVVSSQNCINEERIAGVVGWGRTVGCVVGGGVGVELFEPGHVRRTMMKNPNVVSFHVGEPHGRITPRVEELVGWLRGIDSAKATSNLWGERWSKLVQNAMGNPVTAATGLTSGECLRDQAIRRFSIRIAGEAVRVGQTLGYPLEKIRGIEPERYARAAEGDAAALAELEAALTPKGDNPREKIQRPSMAQDILKGRRTEIDAMNGLIARRGAEVGVPAPANARIADIVTRVERGALKPSPSLLQG